MPVTNAHMPIRMSCEDGPASTSVLEGRMTDV